MYLKKNMVFYELFTFESRNLMNIYISVNTFFFMYNVNQFYEPGYNLEKLISVDIKAVCQHLR